MEDGLKLSSGRVRFAIGLITQTMEISKMSIYEMDSTPTFSIACSLDSDVFEQIVPNLCRGVRFRYGRCVTLHLHQELRFINELLQFKFKI